MYVDFAHLTVTQPVPVSGTHVMNKGAKDSTAPHLQYLQGPRSRALRRIAAGSDDIKAISFLGFRALKPSSICTSYGPACIIRYSVLALPC